MKTTKDILSMCYAEYCNQLSKWYSWENIVMAVYVTVLAFDYISRGEY